MLKSKPVFAAEKNEQSILIIRGEKVIEDADLAEFYSVPTRRLNEQVKRDSSRFPGDFVFQLTQVEKAADWF